MVAGPSTSPRAQLRYVNYQIISILLPNCAQASTKLGQAKSDISQSKSKMSDAENAEKTTVKKKKEEEKAMDDVQPFDSISNVSPN